MLSPSRFSSHFLILFLFLSFATVHGLPTGEFAVGRELARRFDGPQTVQQVTSTNTPQGVVTTTCTVTLTPTTDASGQPKVVEVKECIVSLVGGSSASATATSLESSTVISSVSVTATDLSSSTSASSVLSTTSTDTASSESSSSTSSSVASATSTDSSSSSSATLTSSSSSSSASVTSTSTSASASETSSAALSIDPVTSVSVTSSSTASSTSSSATSSTSPSATSSTSATSAADQSSSSSSASGSSSAATLSTSSIASAGAAGGTAAAETASATPFAIPGKKLQVLPIGLGVFAGISVIALIVVALVTYERTKYRKLFRQNQSRLAESGASMGYGGMAQRNP